jgi:flagellum-specific peptidoglycan hydrolase FlgJ
LRATAGQKKCLQFLKQYNRDLVQAKADSNIFLATAVAQKCIESGYGTSSLARNYNNYGT